MAKARRLVPAGLGVVSGAAPAELAAAQQLQPLGEQLLELGDGPALAEVRAQVTVGRPIAST